MRKYVLFDLDGTLTDSCRGITNAVAYALDYYGIHVEDKDILRPFIGPPLRESFRKFYGFSEEKALEAVEKYREYYTRGGMFENQVYEGIPELLGHLKEAGCELFVATSKPRVMAIQILEHFDLARWFTDIQGPELNGLREKKAEVIRYVLEKNQITDRSQAVMVGDRLHDVEGALACRLSCIGVLYGFGSRKELEQAGADRIAENVAKLEGQILSM